MNEEQFLHYLKTKVELLGTQYEYAKTKGVSAAHISDILSGKRRPSDKLLAAMGFERIIIYMPKADV